MERGKYLVDSISVTIESYLMVFIDAAGLKHIPFANK